MTRALRWDGCLNVRDLGGVPLAGGGETRFGELVRADSVPHLSEEGWRAFAEHGIRRVVDLRWPEERADDPPHGVDVEVVHVSLLGPYDPDVDGELPAYIAADDVVGFRFDGYTRWLDTHRPRFAEALGAIADSDGPTVFHCRGGKDRTGLVAALLLRLAGASIDDVAADYALSEANFLTGGEEKATYFVFATPAEGMARTLAWLEERHGGVEPYLRGCGLDGTLLERLRTRLAA
ncbi:MAG TPA: tyrosine-protein phosphatase [Gaiellaceae bacterium]|nr:tyrosine-protein phosphatase [Gaiellaceae bacterium]